MLYFFVFRVKKEQAEPAPVKISVFFFVFMVVESCFAEEYMQRKRCNAHRGRCFYKIVSYVYKPAKAERHNDHLPSVLIISLCAFFAYLSYKMLETLVVGRDFFKIRFFAAMSCLILSSTVALFIYTSGFRFFLLYGKPGESV